jgi:hypothetical protein
MDITLIPAAIQNCFASNFAVFASAVLLRGLRWLILYRLIHNVAFLVYPGRISVATNVYVYRCAQVSKRTAMVRVAEMNRSNCKPRVAYAYMDVHEIAMCSSLRATLISEGKHKYIPQVGDSCRCYILIYDCTLLTS